MRIIQIASLGVTLEKFVLPVCTVDDKEIYEYFFVHSSNLHGNLESAVPLRVGRKKMGILSSWLNVNSNSRNLMSLTPTLINVHTPSTAFSLFPTLIRMRKQGVKLVYTARGSFDEGGNWLRRFLWKFIDPLNWRIWDGVCVVNNHLLDKARMVPQRVNAKFSLGAAVPNIDPKLLIGPSVTQAADGFRPIRLAWVGRPATDKRLGDFEHIVNRLASVIPQGCVGEVIGTNFEGDGRAPRRSNSAHIRYHGWLDAPHTVVSDCDFLISTSVREGYGMAPLEAALVGTPTIAVANHGARELVPYIGGRLVRQGKLEEIVAVVKEFAEQPVEIRDQKRIRVQQLSRSFLAESNLHVELERFYEEIMSK